MKGTEYVGPVNLIIHCLFEQIDVTLQGKLSTATTYYPYKAYLQELLNFGDESKVSQMSTKLWIKDIIPDSNDAKTGDPALVARAKPFLLSKQVHLMSDLCHDVFNLDKYLLNQVGVVGWCDGAG